MRNVRMLALTAVVAAIVTACGSSQNTGNPGGGATTPPSPPAPPSPPSPPAPAVPSIPFSLNAPVGPGGTPGTAANLSDNTLALLGPANRIGGAVSTEVSEVFTGLDVPSPMAGFSSALLGVAGAIKDSSEALSGRVMTQAVRAFASGQPSLSTGDYTCTSANACTKTAPSDDLIVRWKTKAGKNAVGTVDWDGSSSGEAFPPVMFMVPGSSQKTPFPQKALASITVDGVEVANIKFAGVIEVNPNDANTPLGFKETQLSLDIKSASGTTSLIKVPGMVFKVSASNFETAGSILVNTADDSVDARWAIQLGGQIDSSLTAYSNPFFPLYVPFGWKPKAPGSVAASLKVNAALFAFKFTISDWTFNSGFGEVIVTDGSLEANGKSATFAGEFGPDSNGNCVIGDGINVTLAGGTVRTLDQVLSATGVFPPCNAPVGPLGR